MEWFSTIGNARAQAQANVKRDEVSWVILRYDEGNRVAHYDGVNHPYGMYCYYAITDIYDSKIKLYTLIDTVKAPESDPNLLSISLSKEQWLLVKEMLDIDDEEGNITPEKQGLLDKLKDLV